MFIEITKLHPDSVWAEWGPNALVGYQFEIISDLATTLRWPGYFYATVKTINPPETSTPEGIYLDYVTCIYGFQYKEITKEEIKTCATATAPSNDI